MMPNDKAISRRLSVLSLLALPLVWVERALAIPVIDVAGIAQTIAQIAETVRQIEVMRNQVRALQNAARQLDPRSYQGIEALLRDGDLKYEALTRDISSIGYTLERVNRQFRRIFPNEEAVQNMRASEYEATSRQMNHELYDSAFVAARAQSTLSGIEANNAEAQQILRRSEGNGSQVAQLQSALQMLALMHQNLVAITQTISSAGRVSSDLAAAAVTERRMRREKRRRLLRNYSRGSGSPGVDRRFLR